MANARIIFGGGKRRKDFRRSSRTLAREQENHGRKIRGGEDTIKSPRPGRVWEMRGNGGREGSLKATSAMGQREGYCG